MADQDSIGAEYFFTPSQSTGQESAHWADGSDLWDRATVADIPVPGVVGIKSPKRAQKLDVKSAKGKNTTKITINGYDPAKFDMVIRLVDRDDADAWEVFGLIVEPSPQKDKVTPLTVEHPALKMRAIS
jgi:hypothetical protein